MIFRRLIVSALLVGFVAGILLSLAQISAVNPIIFSAETFEVEEPANRESGHHGDGSDHAYNHAHSHTDGHDSWSPQDGTERTLFTILSNILAGIGFAAVMLALMSQLQSQGVTRLSTLKGLLWGTAGFMAFFAAPAIGLPPEIPGMEAAVLEHRQLWWVVAVVGVGIGLLILSFAPIKYKLIGVLLILVPYLIPVPHHQGPAFVHPDPLAVAQLTELHQQFMIASSATNFAFWVALGLMCARLLNHYIYRSTATTEAGYV